MQRWKFALEAAFGRYGDAACRRPWRVIVAMALLYCALIAQLPRLTTDTSIEGFLRSDDPVLRTYNSFREQFGRDELIIIAVETSEIFTHEFLQTLQNMHAALESGVPFLNRIDSLVNARSIYADADELIVEELLHSLPASDADLRALRERALSHPLYADWLLSADATVTTLLLELDAKYSASGDNRPPDWRYLGDQQMQAAAASVAEIVGEYQSVLAAAHIAGSPAFMAAINKEMKYNTLLFAALTVLIVVVVLALLFRRASGVLLPLLLVFLALSSTFASLPLFGAPFQLPMTILPSFVLAVGVGTAVHVLTIFYRRFDSTGDKRRAIGETLSHTGLAVLFTSATTAAGLSSFAGGELVPVANLGIFSAVSMAFIFCYTIFLLPALIAVLPLARRSSGAERNIGLLDRFTAGCAAVATRFAVPVVLFACSLLVAAVAFAAQLKFSHDMKLWFSPDHPIIAATDFIEQHFGGTVPLEILVDAGPGEPLQDPELLAKLDFLQGQLAGLERGEVKAGKTFAVANIIKETNQALHGNDAGFYRIPQRPDLLAQEFFLLELSGTDDLFKLVDADYQLARTTVMLPMVDAFHYDEFMRAVEDQYRQALGSDIAVTTTGMLPLLNKTMSDVVRTTARSYIIAMLVITLMMIILLGSLKLGLLSMLPNMLPVVVALGLMSIFGAPLDMYSMTIGAIAIGLSVDDTVHFMHTFQRYLHQTGDVAKSVKETLAGTGSAMTITTIVISLSFFSYMYADMINLFNFGLYTGICIVLALLADLLFAPALMALVYRSNANRIAGVPASNI